VNSRKATIATTVIISMMEAKEEAQETKETVMRNATMIEEEVKKMVDEERTAKTKTHL
jgi:hypothetical protein